jgi:hypothetical protein
VFRAKVIDAKTDSFVFEVTGTSDKVQTFVGLMEGLGLVESAAPASSPCRAAARRCEILAGPDHGWRAGASGLRLALSSR